RMEVAEPENAERTAAVVMPAGSDETAVLMRVETAADDVDPDRLEAAAPVEPATPAEPAAEPAPAAEPRRRRMASPLGWTVAVVLMASLLAGAWRWLANRTAADPVTQEAADETAQAASTPAPPA